MGKKFTEEFAESILRLTSNGIEKKQSKNVIPSKHGSNGK